MTDLLDRLTAALSDRYRIERELGQGGMATVYLAEDLKHERKVALKVLKPELAAVLGADRFVQEIKTTASLQHPHILPLFDSGQADGFLYYVMPYIEGETLREKLDRETQLGIDEAVKITTEVADALDHAHRNGVIHRDIKPENILLHDGRPMVADFGIALAVSAAAGGRMTETGLSLGTPHYMSPEQATAEKDITARSDVYSLASVLYEMLTGDPPHTGSSAQQIIMKIVTEEAAPVTRARKSVPSNVVAAVSRALEKLAADRFDSARAFSDALADPHFGEAERADASPLSMTASRSSWTIALGVALIAVTVIAGWALTRPTRPEPVIRYGLALPPNQAPDPTGYALATSDGSSIVYLGASEDGAGGSQLWAKRRDRLTAAPLEGTENASAAAISPDDAWIAVVQGHLLRKVPMAGGTPIPVTEGVSNARGSVAWLDDETIAYLARDRFEIVRIPDEGGTGTTVWSSDSLYPSHLTPLPDARGVLFQACVPPCQTGDLWVLDLRTGSARVAVPDARSGYYVATGHLVYAGEGQTVQAIPFDLKSLETRGASQVVLGLVAFAGVNPYFSISRSGTLLMKSRENPAAGEFEAVWVDELGRETPVDSSWTFRVTQFAADYGWALSPSGDRLAIGLNTPAGDDIWIKELPLGPLSRVTYGSGPERRPRWMPDGGSVTFVSDGGFFLRRADGTGSDSLLWPGSYDEGLISPDGRWLLFRRGARSSVAGGRDIYGVQPAVDSALVPLVATPFDEMAIALSPDGRWLAYQSDETGRLEVFIRPFPNTDDAKVQVSRGGATGPLWARDGRELYYLSSDNTMMAVSVTAEPALGLGEPRALFRLQEAFLQLDPARYYTPWDIGPEGRFLMVRSVDTGREWTAPLIVVENWFEELKARLNGDTGE